MSSITQVYETNRPEVNDFSFAVDSTAFGPQEMLRMLLWLMREPQVNHIVIYPGSETFAARFSTANQAADVLDMFCDKFRISPFDNTEEPTDAD